MVTGETLRMMLRLMYLIRCFEERAKKIFRERGLQGEFLGALHSYAGEEAVAVGTCVALNRNDYIVSTHRGHGHCIAKGGDVRYMLAEIMGKETGYCRGRGGSMHMGSVEIGMLGGNGIVGAGIPIAVGAAFSADYKGSGQVTVCFFGDGAAGQGTFHESLNIASLWKLPVIFVCENNMYAVTTPVSQSFRTPNIADMAHSYGMPGRAVDGNDVLAVYGVASEAVERARAGRGPTLVECKTYRFEPHCMVIAETRSPEEIESWKRKDPINRLEEKLLTDGIVTLDELERMRVEVVEQMDEAERFAEESPCPKADTLKDGLYSS